MRSLITHTQTPFSYFMSSALLYRRKNWGTSTKGEKNGGKKRGKAGENDSNSRVPYLFIIGGALQHFFPEFFPFEFEYYCFKLLSESEILLLLQRLQFQEAVFDRFLGRQTAHQLFLPQIRDASKSI